MLRKHGSNTTVLWAKFHDDSKTTWMLWTNEIWRDWGLRCVLSTAPCGPWGYVGHGAHCGLTYAFFRSCRRKLNSALEWKLASRPPNLLHSRSALAWLADFVTMRYDWPFFGLNFHLLSPQSMVALKKTHNEVVNLVTMGALWILGTAKTVNMTAFNVHNIHMVLNWTIQLF